MGGEERGRQIIDVDDATSTLNKMAHKTEREAYITSNHGWSKLKPRISVPLESMRARAVTEVDVSDQNDDAMQHVSSIEFNVAVFFEELIIHFFSPLSFAYIVCAYGWPTLANKSLNIIKIAHQGPFNFAAVRGLIIHLIDYYTVTAVRISSMFIPGLLGIYWPEIVVMECLFFIRCGMTALRHAFIPAESRKMILYGSQQEAGHIQTVTSLAHFFFLDECKIEWLLRYSAMEHGFDMSQHFHTRHLIKATDGATDGATCGATADSSTAKFSVHKSFTVMELGQLLCSFVRAKYPLRPPLDLFQPWRVSTAATIAFLFALLLASTTLVTRILYFGFDGWYRIYLAGEGNDGASNAYFELALFFTIWWETYILAVFLNGGLTSAIRQYEGMVEMGLCIMPPYRRASLGKYASGSLVVEAPDEMVRPLLDLVSQRLCVASGGQRLSESQVQSVPCILVPCLPCFDCILVPCLPCFDCKLVPG
jgi:hypothetical protein